MDEISRSYQIQLIAALKDPIEAAAYLDAALEEGSVELFLLALQNVAEARNTQSFATEKNPRLSTLAVTSGKANDDDSSSYTSISTSKIDNK